MPWLNSREMKSACLEWGQGISIFKTTQVILMSRKGWTWLLQAFGILFVTDCSSFFLILSGEVYLRTYLFGMNFNVSWFSSFIWESSSQFLKSPSSTIRYHFKIDLSVTLITLEVSDLFILIWHLIMMQTSWEIGEIALKLVTKNADFLKPTQSMARRRATSGFFGHSSLSLLLFNC